MAPSWPQLNPARMRSYVFRLPLFTRVVLFLILLFWLVGIQSVWDIVGWGALVPKSISLLSSACTPCLYHAPYTALLIWE